MSTHVPNCSLVKYGTVSDPEIYLNNSSIVNAVPAGGVVLSTRGRVGRSRALAD